MELKKCPECGSEIDQRASICPKCGYPFDSENDFLNQEDPANSETQNAGDEQTSNQNQNASGEQSSQNGQQARKTPHGQGTQAKKEINQTKILRNCLLAGMIIFALIATIFFIRAHNVRTVYRNSDYYYISQNAYVGGDAYNYIINGTYFTGYSVTASGCMICAVICGIGAAVTAVKKRETGASDAYAETKNHSDKDDIESELPEI